MVFSNTEDYNFVFFEGPWMFVNHYLIIQRWRSFFPMHAEETKKIAVWVKIQCLLIELYNDVFSSRIRMSLGKFLK